MSRGRRCPSPKGNILDPIDLIDGIELDELVEKRTADMMQPQLKAKIEKHTRDAFPEGIAGYGTDALRFTFYSLATTGRDIKFDLGRTEGYRNFCNKSLECCALRAHELRGQGELWTGTSVSPAHLSIADQWISSRFEQTASEHRRIHGKLPLRSSRPSLSRNLSGTSTATGMSNFLNQCCGTRKTTPTRRRRHAGCYAEHHGEESSAIASLHALYHRRDLAAYCPPAEHSRREHHAAALSAT